MSKALVIVNSTGDTFTPTHSGAIATWIWEVSRAAQKIGIEPWVLTRKSCHDSYPWVKTVELEYPFPPRIKGAGKVFRWIDRRLGWQHIRQGSWMEKILKAVRANGWTESTLLFHNDPELVSALRPRLPRANLVHLFHNTNTCLSPWRERFSSSADVVMAVSEYCARWNERHYDCAVHILRNGVDVERFRPVIKTDRRVPVVGFVGRTDRQKAPDLLLKAALNLAESGGRFDLQLLGSRFYGSHQCDSYQQSLSTLVNRLEKYGVRIHRPGFVGRLALPRVLANADINVVPSRWEDPCPLTVLEGMSTGQATIVAKCGGMPEQVGDAGILFERDNVRALEKSIRGLIEDNALRRDYGIKARERALERPWTVVLNEMLETINF